MKKLIACLALFASFPALAQFTPGQILTAAQLNSQFALYAPAAGATFTGPVIAPSLTLNTTPLGTSSGGTGATTTAGALANLGALPLTGGTLTGAFTAPTVTTPATGQFYQNAGANVSRVQDRLLVGPAALNNATNVASQPDWLTTYQIAKGRTYGYVQTSQLAVLNGLASQDSLTTFVAAAQSTGRTGGSQVIAVTGMGVNNNSTGNTANAAWAGYFEAFRDTTTSGNGGAYGIEIDTMNFTNATPVTDPYSQANDQTISMQLASGGGFPGTLYPTTVGINFQNNNTTFDKGIVFGSNSITGATGSSGIGIAIALGLGHELQWYSAAATPTSSILSTGTTSAGGIGQVFSNNTVQWNNVGGNPIFSAVGVTSGVNYAQALGAATGQNPQLAAVGTDTNINLQLTPKGTGAVMVSGPLNASGNDALLYTNTSAQSISTATPTTVTNWTKTFDRVNANFVASTGVFTAPATGYYHISAQLVYAAVVSTADVFYEARVVANGATVATGVYTAQGTTSANPSVSVSAVVSLTSGQTIVLQAFQNSGGSVALTSGTTQCYLNINRVP